MAAADILVTGIDWLITVDESRRVIRDAGVAIKDGRFTAVGKSAVIEAEWQAGTVIAGADRVATPGLIDNHLHSSFQMSPGLADEVNAQAFLFDRMYPFEGVQEREDVLVSASLAAIELLSHGVTCFIDPGNYHPDATVEAVAGAGMRMVVARSTFDRTKSVMGLLPESMIDSTETALAAAEEILDKYASAHDGRVRASASFRGLNNSSGRIDPRPARTRREIRHSPADPCLLQLLDPRRLRGFLWRARDRTPGAARRPRRALPARALGLARAPRGGDPG